MRLPSRLSGCIERSDLFKLILQRDESCTLVPVWKTSHCCCFSHSHVLRWHAPSLAGSVTVGSREQSRMAEAIPHRRRFSL